MTAWKPIVGKHFSPADFATYVDGLQFTDWRPSFCVLHNTAVPNLAQRPHGLTHDHILGLQAYYRDDQHWSAGPHLFVDQNGIWVFTPLTETGVHSPSWNHVAWGVEMLGDYETEAFDAPPGLLVRDNAVAALAILHMKAKLDSSTLRLHKEDPATTHVCPGKHVVKADVIKRVHDEIVRRRP